jgi:hypothetical protein
MEQPSLSFPSLELLSGVLCIYIHVGVVSKHKIEMG